jgi:2-dehydro-3-deoxyphosphooctonate aldolase (KDO 8-P synthase)
MKFIIGPCALESNNLNFNVAKYLKNLEIDLKHEGHNVEFIYKSCYRKPHRSKLNNYHGIDIEEAKCIYDDIKKRLNLKICTDVHCESEISEIKDYVDYIQIPEKRCKDTRLILYAAEQGKPIVYKKGVWMGMHETLDAVDKIRSVDRSLPVYITDRGISFGYNNMIVDFRTYPDLLGKLDKNTSICIDTTHNLKGYGESKEGGSIDSALALAKAAIVNGANTIFIETHPNPSESLCDGNSSIDLKSIGSFVKECLILKEQLNGERPLYQSK